MGKVKYISVACLIAVTGCGVLVGSLSTNNSGGPKPGSFPTRILVGGSQAFYNGTTSTGITRLNLDGSLDTTFKTIGTGFNAPINTAAIDSYGRPIVGGQFTSYNGTPVGFIARLNTDGSLDTTFGSVNAGFDWIVNTIAIDPSGKMIVAGGFGSYGGIPTGFVARLNSDGTLDNTFSQTGTGIDNIIASAKIDTSGKIVVVGHFTSYNGTSEPHIARLNSNGTLDGTFNPTGTGLGNDAYTLAFDSSGKILVGGLFVTYNVTSERFVARINTNGSLDPSFAPVGLGINNQVQTIVIDSSNKIVVGGAFNNYNGTPELFMARLNIDGSLDPSFAPVGTGLNNQVGIQNSGTAISIDSSGKFIVVGFFTSYNGTSENYVARLNSDGSLDTTFASVGTGFDNTLNFVTIGY